MASSSKLRSSSSLPNLLLSSLHLLLLLLSSASFVPLLLLRTPPTSFGWALIAASAAALLSSLIGFYSHLTHLCFAAHIPITLASALGQALGFLALYLRPGPSLRLLDSTRGPGEQTVLVRIEEGMLVGMVVVQSAALVTACAVQRWWVREYEGLEAERERVRRSRRVAVEPLANDEMAAAEEEKGREMDERTRGKKHVQWVKNDFEGRV